MKKLKTAYPDRYDILKQFVKENRDYATEAEDFLWQHLRNNQLGVKFRRQHAIADYIADFFCLKANLIIEVDGGYHNSKEQMEDDEIRTRHLNELGYRVIRFTNEEILLNIDFCLEIIKK